MSDTSEVLMVILRDDGNVTIFEPSLECISEDRSSCWPMPTVVKYSIGDRIFKIEISSCVRKPPLTSPP